MLNKRIRSYRLIFICIATTLVILIGMSKESMPQEAVTVEQLYGKILENYGKIQDMKMKVFIQEVGLKNQRKSAPPGYDINPFYDGVTQEFWVKAPDLRMWVVNGKKEDVFTADKQISRRFSDGEIEETEINPADFTVNPADPAFYKSLIDYLRKYEAVQIIGNPEPDIYVIKAVPLSTHPEDEDQEGMYLEIKINFKLGVLDEMVFRSPLINNQITRDIRWQNQGNYQGVQWPTKITMTTNYYQFNKTDQPLDDVSEMVFLMSEIQINTGTIRSEDFKI